MLPSLINQTTIFVHPTYIAAVKHTGVFNKVISQKTVINVEPLDSGAVHSGVIAALKKLLAKPEWKNFKANIVLASDFTHLRVVAWHDSLTQHEQKMRVLDQLQELYGVDGQSFHVFMSDNGYRKNSLAFAMDESFYQELKGLEAAGLFKLHSILPYFVVITNYWRQSIKPSAWIVIKESAHIYYAKLIDHSWSLMKVITEKEGWEQEAAKMLHRDQMQSEEGAEVNQVYFHDESFSNTNTDAIKNIHQNVVILGRNFKKDSHQQLSFLSYLP